MATTAKTSRTTPTVRGNHPAGRALRGGATARQAVDGSTPPPGAPLRLVPTCEDGSAEGPVAPRWADVVPLHPVPDRYPREAVHPGSAPLRLTRRGRRAVLGLVVTGGLALAAVAGPAVLEGRTAASGLTLAGESSVVVAPGDTLWSIAGTLAPEADRRAIVDALRAVNDLDGVALVPGQVLQVP